MRGKRTWRWWVTRIELGIGIGTVALVLWFASALTQPMFGRAGPSLGPVPGVVAVVLSALALALVGLLWMIRIFPGPSDEPPPWRFEAGRPTAGRYRLNTRRPPDAPTLRPERTPAWWSTRILLGIGIASVLAIGLGVVARVALPQGLSASPPVSLGPLLIPREVLIPSTALIASMVGLVRMIRIFRGPRDEPPPWRYRAR
jgi:hypothetical protein